MLWNVKNSVFLHWCQISFSYVYLLKEEKNLWQRSDCRFFSFNFLSYSFAYNYFLDILDQQFSNSNVFFKQNYIWALIVYMENSSLLFSSCHLKLIIFKDSRFFFLLLTSKSLALFPESNLKIWVSACSHLNMTLVVCKKWGEANEESFKRCISFKVTGGVGS